MKTLSQHILEKLKVSARDNASNITLEKLIDVFKRFEERNKYPEVKLKDILSENPKVLDYTGSNSNKIIGNDILRLGYRYDSDEPLKYQIYTVVETRFGSLIVELYVNIENTKELYEIFGEDVLSEIYDYLEYYENN